MPVIDDLFARLRGQRVKPTKTQGAPGTALYGGYVVEREKAPDLASHDARYRTYADILSNTSIVAAGVRYFVNLVGGAAWSFVPSEADVGGEYAERVEAMMTLDSATPWHRVVRRAAMYRFYGFSVQEWTARKRDDGWLTFADIAPRAQATIQRWDVDPTGVMLGAIQTSPQTQREIYLPREKLLYVVDDTLSDSPEGLGLFRHLVSSARRLSRYEQLEGFGFETDLRGVPVVRLPLTELNAKVNNDADPMTKADRQRMIDPFLKFAENHIRNPRLGLLLDSMTYETHDEAERPSNVPLWNVELLTGSATSFAENAAAIERLNREMARILGVEQLLLGAGQGSYALSRDKTHQFYLLVDGALTEIREAVEHDLLRTLWMLNGWPPELMPEIRTQAVQHQDIQQIGATLRDMAMAGAVLDPSDPVIGEVRDLMGVSRPDSTVSIGDGL